MLSPLQFALLSWYRQSRRNLPWRGQPDPYRILLSEVLLQQTRVEQAIPFYERFLLAFPTLEALGRASQEEVLKAWQGAGYYSRVRNLQKLAAGLAGSVLPASYEALLKLPGLGPYTAAAVASIAFGEAVAAVDGNVRRVVCRLKAWPRPTVKEVQQQADQLLVKQKPGEWNQAMMELGAMVCTARNPSCTVCPVARWCKGKSEPGKFPTPKARKQKSVELVALVLVGPGGVHLEPRTGRMLGGLWGVPMEEEPGGLKRLLDRFGLKQAKPCGVVQHAFTHRKLTVQVYRARWAATEQPQERPLSRLDRKVLRCVGIGAEAM
jgi:A/G-specific adenine glycosylase